MEKIKKVLVASGLVGASLLLAGCSATDWMGQKAGEQIMEKAIESGTGGKVNVDADKGTMTIDSKEGQMTLSGGETAKKPDNLPSDVFIYDNAKFVFSLVKSQDEFSVVYTTVTDVNNVFDEYKNKLSGDGWQKQDEMDLGTGGKVLNFKKNQRKLMVTIGPDTSEKGVKRTSVSIVSTSSKNEQSAGSSSSSGTSGGSSGKVMPKPEFVGAPGAAPDPQVPAGGEVMPKPDFPTAPVRE